jgi:GGDEF domain-containing protein
VTTFGSRTLTSGLSAATICSRSSTKRFIQITITDFPTGLGNARAFGEAFEVNGRRSNAQLVVAVIGVEAAFKTAMSSHDVLAEFVSRLRRNRPHSWYTARVGDLEIGLVVSDESAKRVEEALDRWSLDCEADNACPWRGVVEVDPATPVDIALTRARERRRNQSG